MKSQNIRHQNIPEGLKIISGLSVWSVQVVLVLVSVPSGHSGFYPKWLLHVIVTITLCCTHGLWTSTAVFILVP